MVIIKIFQGIGNQMFQYAYGRAQSLRLKTPLKLDISYYIDHSVQTQYGYTYKRDYGLDRFNISAEIASVEECSNLIQNTGIFGMEYFGRVLRNKILPNHLHSHVKEELTSFNNKLLKIADNTYAEGYFTSDIYFKDYAEVIRKDFELKDPPSSRNLELIKLIQEKNSVCISIRRTNFLSNPLHGVCGEEYYYNAIDLIAKKIENPFFVVFSDDNEWVQKYFKINFDHIHVTDNNGDFYEDLRLMSYCKHHIIPNSTFSWWGAWLSTFPEKIVIAPKYWLNSSEIDYSYFLPKEWIKLDHQINTNFTGD